VYTRPATTFVAGFIGSPPMNLIPGRLDAEGTSLLTTEGERARLAARLHTAPTMAHDGALPLNFEAQHLQLFDPTDGRRIEP
jgi:sn-glycerol 3-phosphate transport system ATP-binding protein